MRPVDISLNPVSYVVLGFAARESPVTSYDLKQMVASSVGYFWPFPHSQLYAEPARLVSAGLLDEEVEEHGRRRRLYRITQPGRAALREWIGEPSGDGTEVRDLGLLKLFFAASASADEVAALADHQTEVHERMLAEYDALNDAIHDGAGEWELATLDLGRRFEQLTIDFWSEVGVRARQGRAAPIKPRR
jgi:DNA-binding PadR family transcriptional regulator